MNVLLRCLRRPRLSWMVALYTALLVAVSAAWIARDRQIGPPPDSEFHLGVCQAVARAITLDGPGGAGAPCVPWTPPGPL